MTQEPVALADLEAARQAIIAAMPEDHRRFLVGFKRGEPDWAERIRVVMDNLSTHTAGALYETFPAPDAHRLLQRLEFHYTPKHASWLNMVEIEIGVLRGQCLNRRIGERETLVAEVKAWQHQRNASGARINWMFTTERACTKLARVYPKLGKESS